MERQAGAFPDHLPHILRVVTLEALRNRRAGQAEAAATQAFRIENIPTTVTEEILGHRDDSPLLRFHVRKYHEIEDRQGQGESKLKNTSCFRCGEVFFLPCESN